MISQWFESVKDREQRETLELIAKVNAKIASLCDNDWLESFLIEILPDDFDDIQAEYILSIIKRIVIYEGSYHLETLDISLQSLSVSDGIKLRERLRRKDRTLIYGEKAFGLFKGFLSFLILNIYADSIPSKLSALSIPVIDLHPEFKEFFDRFVTNILSDEFYDMELFKEEFLRLRPIVIPKNEVVLPSDLKSDDNITLIQYYFSNTPFLDLLTDDIKYEIPKSSRAEHTHIIGGSGHGKTELLKNLIDLDLYDAIINGRSVVVIDSQGDMLNSLLHQRYFHPEYGALADRLIIIDPCDMDMPVALNLFALGIESPDKLTKEKKIQSAVSLYAYLFGELLGAELTQRQGTLFSYLARLMIEIPNSTIHTLKDVLEHGEKYKGAMNNLEGTARDFFQTKFFDPSFRPVKSQIVNRLWGILSTGTLDRMFSSKEMKVDFGAAFQTGKIIFVNTAKELLKSEASAFFGRFILSLISHATLERAGIAKGRRVPVSVYLDEAHEYLDTVTLELFNQARKYDVSLTVAHQNLDQLDTNIRSTLAASTSVKFAGGVSDKDARSLAGDMKCSPNFISLARKRDNHTSFALYVRNVFERATYCHVPLGQMDRRSYLTDSDLEILYQRNRELYGRRHVEEIKAPLELPIVSKITSSPKEIFKTSRIPKEQGKGGQEHKYLQALVKRLGEASGYLSEIEKAVKGGFIDVLLRRDAETIAVEISIGTDANYEVSNARKCLDLNPHALLFISSNKRHLDNVKQKIIAQFNESDISKIHFLLPEAIADYFTPTVEERESEADYKIVNGYKVKVKKSAVDDSDQDARRKKVAEVIARSLGREG